MVNPSNETWTTIPMSLDDGFYLNITKARNWTLVIIVEMNLDPRSE